MYDLVLQICEDMKTNGTKYTDESGYTQLENKVIEIVNGQN